MSLRSLLIAFLIASAFLPLPLSLADEIYKWTDEHGTIHFSDSVDGAPPQFRHQLTTPELKPRKQPSTPLAAPDAGAPAADLPSMSATPSPSPERGPALKRHEVPYKAYEGTARRVILSVTFNDTVTAPMALDTGAPGMLISVDMARKLNLFDSDQARLIVSIGGIGGTTLAVRSIIKNVRVGGATSQFVPIEIVSRMSDAFEGLIGMDFMANYALHIDPIKKVVIFEELPKTPQSPGGHDEEWWRNTFKEFASFHTGWETYRDELERQLRLGQITIGPGADGTATRRDFADWQAKEAEKMLDQLHSYAREHAVPMHWRTY